MSLLLLWNAGVAVTPPAVLVPGVRIRRRRKRCPPVLSAVDALAQDLCAPAPWQQEEQDLETLVWMADL